MNILGHEFAIIESFPDDPQDNTVYVWEKGFGSYWKARCYFGWSQAEGFGHNESPFPKQEAIANAIEDTVGLRLREDIGKVYRELTGGDDETI